MIMFVMGRSIGLKRVMMRICEWAWENGVCYVERGC